MSELFMLSLAVSLRDLRQQSQIHGVGGDEGRMLHHALGETFGHGVVQPFRMLPGRRGSRHATLYAYASSGEHELRRTAQETAPPEMTTLFSLPSLQVKTMPDSWTVGRRLAFDLRVRPVRRLGTPLPAEPKPYRKGAEVDAFVVHCKRAGNNVGGRDALMLRETVYRDWLQERVAGATIDAAHTRMVRFDRSPSVRGSCSAYSPDATFHGELTITDAAAFQQALARGVGRHGAYGFGMLLLRPARRG